MNKEEYEAAIIALNTKRDELKAQGEKMFKDGLRDILKNNPTLKMVSCYVNNHDFNDGEATYFGVSYESCILFFDEDTEYNGYPRNSPFKPLHSEVVDFFGFFDTDNFYERVLEGFGSGRISFLLGEDGELVIE